VSYKILVIDHDPDDVERVQGLLEGAGYQVVVAYDTTAGLVTFQREQPNLVLIEILMPGQRGSEFCENLKNSASGRNCPVVLLSSADESDQELLLQVAQCGCDQVIRKPIAGERLIEICRQLLAGDETPKDDGLLDDVQSALDQLDEMGKTDAPLMNTAEASIDRPAAAERSAVEAVATETAEAASPGERDDLSFIYEESSTRTEQASVNQGQQPPRAAPPSTAPAPSTKPGSTGDQGEDIEAHLNSLFGGASPKPAPPAAAPPTPATTPEPAAPQAKKPDEPDIFKRAHKMVFPEGAPAHPPKDASPAPRQPDNDLTLELENVKAPAPTAPKPAAAATVPPVTASQTEAFSQPAAAPAPRVTAAIEQPTDTRSRGMLWMIAAAAAILIIGAGYFVFFSGSSDEPTEQIADASRSSSSAAMTPPPVRLPASGTESAGANGVESSGSTTDPATETPMEQTRATTTTVERPASNPTASRPAAPSNREASSPRPAETAPPPKLRPSAPPPQRSPSPTPAATKPSSTKQVTSEPAAPPASTTASAGDDDAPSAEVAAATPSQPPVPRETTAPPPEPVPTVASSPPAPEPTSASPPPTAATPSNRADLSGKGAQEGRTGNGVAQGPGQRAGQHRPSARRGGHPRLGARGCGDQRGPTLEVPTGDGER